MKNEKEPAVCEWYLADEDDSVWETTCKHVFLFTTDGPTENKFKFCCYCGKPLTVKA